MLAPRTLAAALLVALLAPAAAADARTRWAPHRIDAGRHTVISDRHPERLDESARRLVALDLFLERWLEVAPARLERPVTLLYLRRTRGMHRKLPFRGDRIGHEHLLPTDTHLWALVREETGEDDLRPAIVQTAERSLIDPAVRMPPWLRAGIYELLARVDLRADDLVLHPASFPSLHEAGLRRAPLADTAQRDWSRYRHPHRWYTASLAVAYLFEEHRERLVAALADPWAAPLDTIVDEAGFDGWVQRAVTVREPAPRVLDDEVGYVARERALDADELRDVLEQLALTHPRGPRAFGLERDGSTPAVSAQLELIAGTPGPACAALAGDDSPEGLYLRGLCLADRAPGPAEELLRRAFNADAGIPRAGVHAAALAMRDPARTDDAAHLAERVLAVAPGDADAELLLAVADVRRTGRTGRRTDPLPAAATPWGTIHVVPGPMDADREGLRAETFVDGEEDRYEPRPVGMPPERF